MKEKLGYVIVLTITLYQCLDAYFNIQHNISFLAQLGLTEDYDLQTRPYVSLIRALFFFAIFLAWTFIIIRKENKKQK